LKHKTVADDAREKTHILVLEPGEEAFAAIEAFARTEGITAASLSAIGAFARATVGWFDLDSRSYREIQIDKQCEVLSAIGDISVNDSGEPAVHIHAVLGLEDGSTRGGHFLRGVVRPTLEVVMVELPVHLRRRMRPKLGIALINL
jgi:predicted DNA-binding protein with PD1-like motif